MVVLHGSILLQEFFRYFCLFLLFCWVVQGLLLYICPSLSHEGGMSEIAWWLTSGFMETSFRKMWRKQVLGHRAGLLDIAEAFQHGRPYYCFIYRGYTRCCSRNFLGTSSSIFECKWPLSGLCGSWYTPDPLKDVSFPLAAPDQNASHFCRLLLTDYKQQWIWSSECVSGELILRL